MKKSTLGLLGLGAAALVTFGIPAAAQAHTPELAFDCDSLEISLTGYPADSTVLATIDGKTQGAQTFTNSYSSGVIKLDSTVAHTFSVVVDSSDGDAYDWEKSGSTTPCEPPVVTPPVEPPVVTPPVEPPVVTPPVEPPVVTPPVEPPVVTPPVEPPVVTPPVEPPVVTPPVEPPVVTPPVEPPVVTPPVEEPPVVTPPVEEPPVVTPPVEEPPVVTPPVEEPPVVTPPVEQPTFESVTTTETAQPRALAATGSDAVPAWLYAAGAGTLALGGLLVWRSRRARA
ncbi:LPXTG cell wall anchor domain-containing protein [Microbacterium sp. P04]|uniref:LPXTG cell wall anchor domain-containing protein n=1 Tax=Microbacterium sp. P04 TaxID=3366947 RepID=UPI0037470C13